MELNRKNYFSAEAEEKYLGSTSFHSWDNYSKFGCEAREMAKLKGEWAEKDQDAFLLGSYVHACSSGDLQEFMSENPQLLKKDGTLLAKYAQGDTMWATLNNDPVVRKLLEGDKEKIFTGEIAGVEFKIMADVVNIANGYFADIKTTRELLKGYWQADAREKRSFIAEYDYFLQFAIYAEIIRQNLKMDKYLDAYIVVVDKQAVSDHAVIYMDVNSFIKEKLEEIAIKLPHIIAVRKGEVTPIRCEHCDYCRSTKKIEKAIHYLDFESLIR